MNPPNRAIQIKLVNAAAPPGLIPPDLKIYLSAKQVMNLRTRKILTFVLSGYNNWYQRCQHHCNNILTLACTQIHLYRDIHIESFQFPVYQCNSTRINIEIRSRHAKTYSRTWMTTDEWKLFTTGIIIPFPCIINIDTILSFSIPCFWWFTGSPIRIRLKKSITYPAI